MACALAAGDPLAGGTDAYPSRASDPETLVVLVLVLIGAFLWTYVLAAFCDVATNSNPALIAFRQQLDGLNLFIGINGLPKEMAQRLRSQGELAGDCDRLARALTDKKQEVRKEWLYRCHSAHVGC